jgi:Domain of unknown function (DUF1906)
MAGFDTCSAPSLRTISVWRARFSAAGIYIGGANMACDYGHLSRGWVRAVRTTGWSLLPIYVGPQPPCDAYRVRIRPGHAAAEGRAAANGAIADAAALGIGRGSPVYYDMEAYNRTRARCVTAVLAFLDAWTRQLEAKGYVPGLYSSADSAVADLQRATRVNGHRLARPRCVWIALWDNREDMSEPGSLLRVPWPPRERSKQYAGPHWVQVGGVWMNIDSDLVGGPVVPSITIRRPQRRTAGIMLAGALKATVPANLLCGIGPALQAETRPEPQGARLRDRWSTPSSP